MLIDLLLCYVSGLNCGSVGVFYNCFLNYLIEYNIGCVVDDDGELVVFGIDGLFNEVIYCGVCVEFYGIELDGKWWVFLWCGYMVDFELMVDYMYVCNVDMG